MPVIRGADIDRVDVFVGDELPKIGVYFRAGEEIVPAFDGPVLKDVAKGGYFNPFIFQVRLCVRAEAHAAAADKANFDFFHRVHPS